MVVAAYDLGFVGAYMLSAFVCPIWFVVAVVLGLAERQRGGVAAARILIPVVMGLLVFGNHRLQGTIAKSNAADVVEACERYRNTEGSYPDRLDQLVPRYLKKVPRAKYCLFQGEFWYYGPRVLPHAMLVWYELPPFGKWIYDFGIGEWRYLE